VNLSLITWIGVALLGGAGAVARFLVDGLVDAVLGRSFPLGTLAVNVSGSFLLGLLAGLAINPNALVLAGTATLGSYTTFSTWMLETHRAREDGNALGAVINITVSLLAGFGAVALGRAIA
jgi:CrcB protein